MGVSKMLIASETVCARTVSVRQLLFLPYAATTVLELALQDNTVDQQEIARLFSHLGVPVLQVLM